jgi:succinoglycan biosynthesis protein ExoV
MKLIYYKSNIGNFGDDLNVYLWDRLLPKYFEEENDIAFLGIGSILTENSSLIRKAEGFKRKVVFGTGVRSINDYLYFDESWHIPFVRGKYSSLKLFGNTSQYISDGAYGLILLNDYRNLVNSKKKNKIGFIPYFRSFDKVGWQQICDKLGWHLISPLEKNISFFIKEVVSCEKIISEAMHGAIIADIYRVPWQRIRYFSHIHETESVSEFKWNDWLSSIEIENRYVEIPYIKFNFYKERLFPSRYKKLLQEKIFNSLLNLKLTFNLSNQNVLDNVKIRFSDELFKLKQIVE